jgi:hypothetical protein
MSSGNIDSGQISLYGISWWNLIYIK